MDGRLLLLVLLFNILLALRSSCQEATRTCTNTTIFEFWHESMQTCALDVRSALEVYSKISETALNRDQFSGLLKHQIGSSLNEVVAQQIIDLISNETLRHASTLDIIEEEMYKSDKLLAKAVWEKALEELLERGIDMPQIMGQILTLTNDKLKFTIIEYFWRRYDMQFKHNANFLPAITFAMATLLKESPALNTQQALKADTILRQLPQQLLGIYQSWNYNVSFVNRRYNEYMFADSMRGPSPQQRFVFTFKPTRGTLRIQGKFKLHFNSRGMVAFAVFSRGKQEFLNSDGGSVHYCLGGVSNPSEWWNVLWPYESLRTDEEQYVYFQHAQNGNLLCASTPYDDNRRWVQIMGVKHYMMVESCQWKVMMKNR